METTGAGAIVSILKVAALWPAKVLPGRGLDSNEEDMFNRTTHIRGIEGISSFNTVASWCGHSHGLISLRGKATPRHIT